ncbi:MAG: SUMF1/EgtB/PvdO family nonheme iron enzyme [Planctomycetes bacterium]|nr:SUMF1/EgtB/PvdO family nonheme iron enzyme [Planctomycetota bacterium]
MPPPRVDILRLKELFDAAAPLTAAQRERYLDEHCPGDTPLRRKLARMLADSGSPSAFAAAGPASRSASAPPRRIGRYVLQAEIGAGGMGVVHRAQQLAPVSREVAIKWLRPGMGSEQVLRRFEREREALAAMNHENVVRVFDAGVTDDGRPYFVMELVDGVPLDRYCAEHEAGLVERIRIFQQVCAGVQHAHQKGVIHRDLKPANVLVCRSDDGPRVRIIDFGLARGHDPELGADTMITRQGMLLGTPEYMSPEQVAGDPGAVDARTDVYSLGVILYELLCGELPLSSADLRDAGLLELGRRISEREPRRPSARVWSQVARRSSGESHRNGSSRQTSPARRALARRLRGDLDWIALRALAKDPEGRYASAADLSADLDRHLACEPIAAGRPGRTHALRKFVRRNRLEVAVAVTVLSAFVAGLLGAIDGLVETEAARRRERLARVREQQTMDPLRVADLLDRARAPWPSEPTLEANLVALELWLEEADLLLGRAGMHEAALAGVAGTWELASPARESSSVVDPASDPGVDHPAVEHPAADDPGSRRDASGDRGAARASGAKPDAAPPADPDGGPIHAGLRPGSESARFAALADMLTSLPELRARRDEIAGRRAVLERHWPLWSVLRDGLRGVEGFETADLRPVPHLIPLGIDCDRNRELGRQVEPLWLFAVGGTGEIPEWLNAETGAPAPYGTRGRLRLVEDSAVILVLLPGGGFWRGTQCDDPTLPNYDDIPRPHGEPPDRSGPVLHVPVKPFFLSKYELTRAQYARFVAATDHRACPTHGAADVGHHAARGIDWRDAALFCEWAGLALPSETRWEYAARAGTTTPFWSGRDESALARVGWYCGNRASYPQPVGTSPTGIGAPNPWGLHDVHGGVREWCQDLCTRHWREGPWDDRARTHGENTHRIARGGGFTLGVDAALAGHRAYFPPGCDFPDMGFRPSCELGRAP